MAVITVARGDLSCAQVAEALRQGLGPHYHVLPGEAIDRSQRYGLAPDEVETIVVGTGSNRWFRAQVTIVRRSVITRLHVIPGGLPGTWPGGLQLINWIGIARRVRRALGAAEFRMPAAHGERDDASAAP
jgi:hypothetical protein